MFINSVLVETKSLDAFLYELEADAQKSEMVSNPTYWYGGTTSSCYITPKEICWFPWKTRYESSNAENYEQYNVLSAVDECCYNSPEYGDVHYNLPSALIRNMLGIVDSDGYIYWDKSQKIVAEYTIAGEQWRTYQSYVLVDKDLVFNHLGQHNKTLVWIMRERRSHSGMSIERHGKFGIDKFRSFVGFFDNGKLTVKEIHSSVNSYIPIRNSLDD